MQTKSWSEVVRSSIAPGMMAALAVSATAAWRGKKEAHSALGPVNATSHIVWGDSAARVDRPTLKHTLVGVVINAGASIFWGAIFEKFFGRAVQRRGVPAAVAGSVVTAGAAYVTDYYLVPRRLTPGYEKRVSPRSLFLIYGVLAVGIAAGSLLVNRKH